MTERTLTPAQQYRDAVWASLTLTPTQRLTALCFANHAKGTEHSWVVLSRLMQQTGIRSKVTAVATVQALVDAGWLKPAGAVSGHRQKVLYRLTIPTEAAPPAGMGRPRGDNGRYVDAAAATPADRSSGWTGPAGEPVHPDGQPVQPMDPNRSIHCTEPVHPVDRTGPAAGPDSRTEDSPKDSVRRDDSPADAAAMLRTATPAATQDPDAADGPPLSADEAKAQLRALGAGRRRADTSHWKVGTAPVGEPNPLFDPAVQGRLLVDAYDEAGS